MVKEWISVVLVVVCQLKRRLSQQQLTMELVELIGTRNWLRRTSTEFRTIQEQVDTLNSKIIIFEEEGWNANWMNTINWYLIKLTFIIITYIMMKTFFPKTMLENSKTHFKSNWMLLNFINFSFIVLLFWNPISC